MDLHNATSAIYSFRARVTSYKRNLFQRVIDSAALKGEGLGAIDATYRCPESVWKDSLHGETCTGLKLPQSCGQDHEEKGSDELRCLYQPLGRMMRLDDHF